MAAAFKKADRRDCRLVADAVRSTDSEADIPHSDRSKDFERTTLDAQAWILHSQIAEEIAAAADYEVVICDRSVLDNYAYLVARVGRRPELDPLVSSWVRGYDALFKVPVLDAPSFDGTRAVSRDFQLEIDVVIDELVRAFGVAVHPLDAAHRGGWTARVVEVLGLPAHPPQIDLFAAANGR